MPYLRRVPRIAGFSTIAAVTQLLEKFIKISQDYPQVELMKQHIFADSEVLYLSIFSHDTIAVLCSQTLRVFSTYEEWNTLPVAIWEVELYGTSFLSLSHFVEEFGLPEDSISPETVPDDSSLADIEVNFRESYVLTLLEHFGELRIRIDNRKVQGASNTQKFDHGHVWKCQFGDSFRCIA